MKTIMYNLSFLDVLNSPFKGLKFKWYFGNIEHGTPYFLPRKLVKCNKKDALNAWNNFKPETREDYEKYNGGIEYWIDYYIKNFTKPVQIMNTPDLEHRINGTTPMPKCNDLYTLLGAVKGKEYSCPKCGKQEDDYDISEGYNVDGENYPKYYNESKGGTIDGNYWDWDEVHRCTGCGTKYWFKNGVY